MSRTSIIAMGALSALALTPAAAGAHVTVHPNSIPAGAFATVEIRVPSEEPTAATTSLRVKLPEGVAYAAGSPVPGWTFKAKTKKLAQPLTTDDGTVSSEVTEIAYSGGRILAGQLQSFPLTVSIPAAAKAGDTLTFPTVQTYANGEVVRWIGSESDEHPAPTIAITAEGGPILDLTGDAPGATALGAGGTTATVVQPEADSTLAIVALIVGALGLATGAGALALRRR
jgi:uncharacterized protein YcnI